MTCNCSIAHWIFKCYFFLNVNWRLITLQYCDGFYHAFTWISHGCTCVPHPEPPFHLPPHSTRQGHPSAPALSAQSIEPGLAIYFTYDNIHVSMLFSNHSTLAFSHRVLFDFFKYRASNIFMRKIPWRRKWQPQLVFLPGKSLGQRSLEGYSP